MAQAHTRQNRGRSTSGVTTFQTSSSFTDWEVDQLYAAEGFELIKPIAPELAERDRP